VSYLELDLVFLAIAVVVGAVALAARGRSMVREWGLPMVIAAVALIVMTAIFDTVMIAVGLFHNDQQALIGLAIGLAPVEDFAYPIAGAILLPSLWLLIPGRRTRA
jgi:lycopene cyclase domain-containing protein